MQAALVIILLLAILAGAVFVGHYGWVSAGDVVMPAFPRRDIHFVALSGTS